MSSPTEPNLPVDPRATNTTLEFYWNPPSSSGNSAISSYTLACTNAAVGPFSYPVGTNYARVTGLTNGSFYDFNISATNVNELTGPSSNYIPFAPGSSVPNPPISTIATALGTNSAIVSWSPPDVLPDSPINWYVIRSSSTNNADTVLEATADGQTQRSYLFSGLNSNSIYTFNVEAVNCPGYSPAALTNFITASIPLTIAGLQVWLDGNDPLGTGVQPSNGATVTTWSDKSGNANNATSGAATFVAGSPGFMNFGGSTYYSLTSGNFIINNYFTFFIVERLQSTANTYPSFFGSLTYPNSTSVTIMNYGDGTKTTANWVRATDNSVSGLSQFTTASAQPTRVWTLRFITNLQTIRLNGTQIYSFVTNTKQTSWLTPLIGGALNNAAFNYFGHMKEILMYTGELTNGNITTIESYLATKWGVTI